MITAIPQTPSQIIMNKQRSDSVDKPAIIGKANTPLFIFLIVQFVGAIWWAATMSERLASQSIQLSELKSIINKQADDRYRGSDAIKDLAERDRRIAELERRIAILEKK